jgi:hypothetical protein
MAAPPSAMEGILGVAENGMYLHQCWILETLCKSSLCNLGASFNLHRFHRNFLQAGLATRQPLQFSTPNSYAALMAAGGVFNYNILKSSDPAVPDT